MRVVHWSVIRCVPAPFILVSSVLAIAALAGCRARSSAADVQIYHLRGTVVSTDPADGIVVVNHEAIPGFMEAMTMPYQLKNPADARNLHPGDTITARVLVSKDSQQTVLLDGIEVVARAKPHLKPDALHRAPAALPGRRGL